MAAVAEARVGEAFVGRGNELARLGQASAAALGGAGSVIVVSGPAGIGKTRFCQEAAEGARRLGLRPVWGRCWAEGGAPALWPWPAVLAQLGGPWAATLLDDAGAGGLLERERFSRFVAVGDHLAAACRAEPAFLVVDDLHAADPAAVLLARYVARLAHALPLVLVVTRRADDGAPPDSETGRLLADLEREAVPLVLGDLDRAETAAFLAAHDPGPRAADEATAIWRLTGGHPLFLRRLVAFGPDRMSGTRPAGLRAAIADSVSRLEGDAHHLLAVAAVLGSAPAWAEVAAVAGTSAAAVLAAADQGQRAGLVAGLDAEGFTFSHDLVRQVLEDALTPEGRLDVHARIAAVLAGPLAAGGQAAQAGTLATGGQAAQAGSLAAGGQAAQAGSLATGGQAAPAGSLATGGQAAPAGSLAAGGQAALAGCLVGRGGEALARRAHHAIAAAARSAADAAVAVAAAVAAADAMGARFAYEQAAELLSTAVRIHGRVGLGEPPAALLVRRAEAVLRCGRLAEARDCFDEAVAAARRDGEPALFAAAALGLGGMWVYERRAPAERERVLGLQRAALAELPAEEASLRGRLVARLAAEAVYQGAPAALVMEALAAVRRLGDDRAVAEALSLTHHALLSPEHARRRLDLADQQIAVASAAGDGVLALVGLCWRAVDLFHLADPRAERALADLRARADTLGCRNILFIADVIDVMLLIREGRLGAAEEGATACFALGSEVGDADAFAYYGTQLLCIRWLQGRETELLDFVGELAASPTLVPSEVGFHAALACVAAGAGQTERARRALARLTEGPGLAGLPHTSTWLTSVFVVVEATARLGDGATARAAYDLLRPFAAQAIMPSLAVACFGSVERPLGLAALTTGDIARAVAHLEAALAANRRLGNRPLVACTAADLAGALRRRAGPDDHRRAAELLDEAIAGAEAMGMAARAVPWRAQRAALEDRATDARPGRLHRAGGHWTVALDGREVVVPDRTGMRYLARLLAHPGVAISALELAGGTEGATDHVHQPVVDAAARAAYARRAAELAEEMGEARAHADLARQERLGVELEALTDAVERATGLHGRPRTFAGPRERARTAVRKAIKRALDEIAAAEPVLAAALRPTIVTGARCCYEPGAHAIAWTVTP